MVVFIELKGKKKEVNCKERQEKSQRVLIRVRERRARMPRPQRSKWSTRSTRDTEALFLLPIWSARFWGRLQWIQPLYRVWAHQTPPFQSHLQVLLL